MNYEVSKGNSQNQKTKLLRDLEHGEIGLVVQWESRTLPPQYVLCGGHYASRFVVSLDEPTRAWYSRDFEIGGGRQVVRLLEPGEEIIIRGKA